MPIRFDQHSTVAMRALQIYLILIGCAANERVITFAALANLMGYPGPTGLFTPLEHLAGWCRREGLPPITSLVVRDENGAPGPELLPPRGSPGSAAPRAQVRLVRHHAPEHLRARANVLEHRCLATSSCRKSGIWLESRVGRWRRRRDSNPRYAFTAYNGLANRRLQPLGHVSSRAEPPNRWGVARLQAAAAGAGRDP